MWLAYAFFIFLYFRIVCEAQVFAMIGEIKLNCVDDNEMLKLFPIRKGFHAEQKCQLVR